MVGGIRPGSGNITVSTANVVSTPSLGCSRGRGTLENDVRTQYTYEGQTRESLCREKYEHEALSEECPSEVVHSRIPICNANDKDDADATTLRRLLLLGSYLHEQNFKRNDENYYSKQKT